MKRIVALLTAFGLMVAMMVLVAAPAFARLHCESGAGTFTCSGGEGSQGGGFGTRLTTDFTQPGYYNLFIYGSGGGGDGSGGGSGVRCTSYLLEPETAVCHGGGSS
jgi:hypothetical protein